MDYRTYRVLEFRRNRFRFAQKFMEIFRFFISISPILLILRISTGQRFRKERSVHDGCMGCIMECIECLISVEKVGGAQSRSWRYLGFHFLFVEFTDFEDLNWSVFEEG